MVVMKDIELVISEGIKNGRWIDISYENSNNEITFYWIAINDINLKSKNLKVTMEIYNHITEEQRTKGRHTIDNMFSQ